MEWQVSLCPLVPDGRGDVTLFLDNGSVYVGF